MTDTEGTDLGAGVGPGAEVPGGDGEVFTRWEERVVAATGAEERLREMAEALLAAQLDQQELERWEVVENGNLTRSDVDLVAGTTGHLRTQDLSVRYEDEKPDRMPPWDQYRLIPRELEMWITGEVHVWERGRDIPRDTPVPELRKRLERAMRKRGGVARVFEKDGRIHVYLSAQTPAWKGFQHERDEPLK